jgi:hypothetical protein
MTRLIMKIWVYVIPVPLFLFMTWVWWRRSQNGLFTAYVMLLPTLYGYIIPGIATNIQKKWRFKGKWVVGNYYIHHGIKYASNMSVYLFLSFYGIPFGESVPPFHMMMVMLVSAGLHGYVSWIHDIYIVRLGMVEIFHPAAKKLKSAEEIVFQYAPLCFFMIGLTYALSSLIAYDQFIVHNRAGAGGFALLLAGGFMLMAIVSSLGYGLTELLSAEKGFPPEK